MKGRAFYMPVAIASLLIFSDQVLANNFIVGHSSNGNVTLNSAANWTIIRTATVIIPAADAATHGCVATASADMDHNGAAGVENQYLFVLARNDSNPLTNTGSERLLELVDNNDVNDPDSKPVSTTQHFTGLTRTNGVNGTGTHNFYFLGRKVEAGDSNADVLDASLSVICVNTP
jgi:hypothetical protein